ncbi:unnamed protein product [Durusdinium trenchii]|uniref:Uncharacterized protein n=1 Tax=Durusdinium trenchii TaxID=1381693 RepID=A0ABP0IM57_9DINO
MLHMHKWRRRQVNNYFLPKTAAERRAVKQKTTAMLSAKDVTTRAANQSLRELRSTILNTATADPLEDAQMTRDQMEALPGATEVPGAAGFSHTMPSGVSPYTSYEQSSRFNGALTDPSFGQQAQDLSKKDRAFGRLWWWGVFRGRPGTTLIEPPSRVKGGTCESCWSF